MRRRKKIVVEKIDYRTKKQYKKIATKSKITPREIKPDSVYDSVLVGKLINRVLKNGKKELAKRIVYGALKLVKEKTRDNELEILKKAIENIRPTTEIRSRRVGGQNYLIPIETSERRSLSLAIRWLVIEANKRKINRNEQNMTQKLAAEILDASISTGGAVKKREELQRTAEVNRAFSHFRW